MPEHNASYADWAEQVMQRCDALAALSSLPDAVCRTYLTPEHQQCNAQVSKWLTAAGLDAWQDAVGNQWGRLPAARADAPALIVGSHLDTIPNAGKYDGILGVLLALAVADKLRRDNAALPFHLDIVGFGDEEGVRFGTTLLGSRAVAGTWESAWVKLEDKDGISLGDALKTFGGDPGQIAGCSRAGSSLAGYIEVHIEQGPVLEQTGQPLGIVTGIAGARRFRVEVLGQAGHAGTVPMDMRQDALAAAAGIVLAVEKLARRHGIVATVGSLSCEPGAANVIPGRCLLGLDVRADSDARRDRAIDELQQEVAALLASRGMQASWVETHNAAAVACSDALQALMAEALESMALPAPRLMSGAGHDAMAIAPITDVGMLFLRCAGGISHHPDESVTAQDVALAMEALERTVLALARQRQSSGSLTADSAA
ncbi:MAG: allantoate amidohydrolase [Halieaceae bacterium]|jgi:allantoate deiminase|nr:allantoate amidohydrolase [Halieaceae bacterium]